MIFPVLFSLALAADPHSMHMSEPSPEAQHEKAHDSKHGAEKLKLNKGQKWQADQPLKSGMAKIRQAVPTDLPPEKGLAASQAVDNAVQDIFKNCKLQPEADATLHVILVDMMKGSSLLKKPQSPSDGKNGIELIHKALNNYETYFDDKGTATH